MSNARTIDRFPLPGLAEPRPYQTESERLDGLFTEGDARGVARYATERFGSDLAIACSLGVEDVVLLDLFAEAATPSTLPRVFVLDTGRLHEETYEVLDRVRQRYPFQVDVYFPEAPLVESLVRKKGAYSFRESIEDRKECCAVRKLGPLARALRGAPAWVTGLRRAQSTARANASRFELDEGNGGLLKISPLADWSDADVWRYAKERKLPYNALHDQGFPSIGCAPCTRAVLPGEDARAGRWWWEGSSSSRECGLHSPNRPKRPAT